MRREERKRNKYCPNKSNLLYVEETENKKSSDKKKPSEVIEVVFEKCDKSKYVSVEKNCGLKVFW